MKFLIGVIVGLIAFPVLAAIYFLGGFAPAAVSARSFPFEQLIAGGALEARLHREAPKRDLSSFTTADLVAGAQTYRKGCDGCHGLPGQKPLVPKMYPEPPELFTPDGYVTDDPVGFTYWKIKNGIRMTGMPSFNRVFSDEEIWQTAALLANADKLPAQATDILKQPMFPPVSEQGKPGNAKAPGK